jgi:L,D-peptidoglycan transpeptidase YkuD (ErfK/YbiS/YcfS/YnhG family)
VAAVAVAVGVAVVPSAPAQAVINSQVVTVKVASSTSTYAAVEAWQRQADGRYRRVAYFPYARVGRNGVGATHEGLARTPAGTFSLSQPFGNKVNPGTTFPYFHVDINDVWAGDPLAPAYYNRHVRCAPYTCPFRVSGYSERLINYPSSYAYAMFIGYNAPAPYGTGAVPGKGSAFFLHVKNAYATGGCVAVSESQMVWLLRWLRPGYYPVITIGVGNNAYVRIPHRYI